MRANGDLKKFIKWKARSSQNHSWLHLLGNCRYLKIKVVFSGHSKAPTTIPGLEDVKKGEKEGHNLPPRVNFS